MDQQKFAVLDRVKIVNPQCSVDGAIGTVHWYSNGIYTIALEDNEFPKVTATEDQLIAA